LSKQKFVDALLLEPAIGSTAAYLHFVRLAAVGFKQKEAVIDTFLLVLVFKNCGSYKVHKREDTFVYWEGMAN
jgi:hypothetical protein